MSAPSRHRQPLGALWHQHSPPPRHDHTYTATGGLVRLVVHKGEVVGAVVIECALPWVYRRAYLRPEDLE